MGDRANIVIKDGGSKVYLYTHWHAQSLPETLRRALSRKRWWGNGSSLGRIIFSEMIRDDVAGLFDYGISSVGLVTNHPDIVVDCDDDSVYLEQGCELSPAPQGDTLSYSFEAYIALPGAQWSDLDAACAPMPTDDPRIFGREPLNNPDEIDLDDDIPF